MYSTSGNANSDLGGEQLGRQGVSEGEMQSTRESGFTEREHISGRRTMMYSASETVNSSHIGGKMDYQGVIGGESQSHKGGFTEHNDISGGRTMMYSSSGTITSSQSAGKMYRHGAIEGGMRTSKDSGLGEQDNVSQNSNEAESYTEANLGKAVGLAHLSQASDEFQIELNENDEEALKEELLHIFERERTSLEVYFKKKMEDVLRGFRSRQMEWDEASRAEKAELERNMSMEKTEMQKCFAEEIDKLTQSFNEERLQLEQYYQEQLHDLREKLATEQREMTENFAKEKIELKEKLEAEYQAMLKRETSHKNQEAMREKTEMEARLKKEKLEIERNFNLRLTESETNVQRVKAEFESNLTQERMRMEKECQEKIRQIEEMLQEERLVSLDMEKELKQEKEKYLNGESSNKKEHERLKNEVDVLRLEIEEKNRINVEMKSFEETVTRKGRDGLSGKLKDDFEKLLADHKVELDKTYHREKEVLDQTIQVERRQMKEELDREKEKIKSETDEIVRTKEMLRVEGQAQIDRQRQQRGDNEWAIPSSGNQQIERLGEVDRRVMPTQQMNDGERLGPQLGDRRIEVSGTMEMTTHRQLIPDDGSNAKRSPYRQPHQQPQQQQQQMTTDRQQIPDDRSNAKESPYRQPHHRTEQQQQQQMTTNRQKIPDDGSNSKESPYRQPHQQPQPQPQQQPPNRHGVWTGTSADSYVGQHGASDSHQQPTCVDYNLKYDPIRQPYNHAGFEYREKQGLPSNKPVAREIGTGSIEQSGSRGNSMYIVPSENESALRFEMNALKSENEGLKAKVTALEENIDLHKKYKEEAKAEMERLLKANQDNDLKIQTLTSHDEELGKKNSENENVKRRAHEGQIKPHTHEDRGKATEKNDRHFEGTLRRLEDRAVRAEKTTKEYDAKMRLTDERRGEKRSEDTTDSHHDLRDQRGASRHQVPHLYCAIFAKSSL